MHGVVSCQFKSGLQECPESSMFVWRSVLNIKLIIPTEAEAQPDLYLIPAADIVDVGVALAAGPAPLLHDELDRQ